MTDNTIPSLLRRWRKYKDYALHDVERKAKEKGYSLSYSTVSKIERGDDETATGSSRIRVPSATTMEAIYAAFDTTRDEWHIGPMDSKTSYLHQLNGEFLSVNGGIMLSDLRRMVMLKGAKWGGNLLDDKGRLLIIEMLDRMFPTDEGSLEHGSVSEDDVLPTNGNPVNNHRRITA